MELLCRFVRKSPENVKNLKIESISKILNSIPTFKRGGWISFDISNIKVTKIILEKIERMGIKFTIK